MSKEYPVTEFLDLPDGRIAYDETGGGGPLVVAVPGMGDVRGVYRFLTPALVAAGHRVVTMDVRGHGESSVGWPDHSAAAVGADIVALLRALDAGPAALLGGSMAAAAAVWAAAEAPSQVSGIVLFGPFVRDIPMNLMGRLSLLVVSALPAAWLSWYARLYPSAPPADLDAYRAALGANLRQPGRYAAFRAMMRAGKADCEARIPQVRAPVLVVMGTKDPDFRDPAAEARLLAERLHGTTLLVDGAGHYPHAEMPAIVGPAVVDFLREVGSRVA